MKTEFEDAARDVGQSVSKQMHETGAELEKAWTDANPLLPDASASWTPPPPVYKHPKKNWRLKRGATPQWYKQRAGVRVKAQSGAARVARFRPPRSAP